MSRLDSDILIAVLLVIACAIAAAASLDIRDPGYGGPGAATWPRLVIGFLGLVSLIYLRRSVARRRDPRRYPVGGLAYPATCFLIFAVFLLTLPMLGMLVGGTLFVFLVLNVLGGWQQYLRHMVIAAASVGTMWALFTYGLHVFLPEGALFADW